MAVPSERPCTNMLDGRSAPASSRETTPDKHARRKVANLQVRAERSWTTSQLLYCGTMLDEHDRRKVQHIRIKSAVLANSFQITFNATRNCHAERQWRFPLNDPGRICSTDGPHQQVPAERSWTNMVGTCMFPRDDPGRTCSMDGPHQQVLARRRRTNMLAGRSPTCKFARNEAGRTWSAPACSHGTTLDEHARRKFNATRNCHAERQWRFPLNDPVRTCSMDGPHQQVLARRRRTNMLAGRSPTCKFARNEAGRTCSTEGRQPASSRETTLDEHPCRKVANLQVPAGRSWTNMLDGRSAPASSRGTTLDEHARRKVQHNRIKSAVLANSFQISFNATRNCHADAGRTCSAEGRHPSEQRCTEQGHRKITNLQVPRTNRSRSLRAWSE
ncbi:hypothetical protein CpipJ_CPIJ018843 [Culex quinquefasciatus]|uniref:Uncharacterized protein n=1 Tax=Culex quinquefasciatus TaxID=7176 RepID=B0XH82_CULQU|nr:hypothetical protein CpipJ_CPIJ018843 [Culex quinquefasciatus]|eukprot:XP_001869004.1 hypothetical protein CpipJ_CPIJ018843 [Culex quinquefasciatus]